MAMKATSFHVPKHLKSGFSIQVFFIIFSQMNIYRIILKLFIKSMGLMENSKVYKRMLVFELLRTGTFRGLFFGYPESDTSSYRSDLIQSRKTLIYSIRETPFGPLHWMNHFILNSCGAKSRILLKIGTNLKKYNFKSIELVPIEIGF